jgi:hypothetical protein
MWFIGRDKDAKSSAQAGSMVGGKKLLVVGFVLRTSFDIISDRN